MYTNLYHIYERMLPVPLYYCYMHSSMPFNYSYVKYALPYINPMFSTPPITYMPYNYPLTSNYMIKDKKSFTTEEAEQIGRILGIDWTNSKFDVEQFRVGLDVELEHGRRDPTTNVTNDNPILTGKIALAHLNEFPDYYTRLVKLEKEAEEYWKSK